MESVLPEAPLRQWVLTVPHAMRHRLAYDAKRLGKVTRAFLAVVLAFYEKWSGRSGCVAVVYLFEYQDVGNPSAIKT